MKGHEIQLTKDGSPTIFLPDLNEHYHSIHGALQESQHVFINQGLARLKGDELSVLEVGLGTGLNAILSFDYAKEHALKLQYTAVEAFPLSEEIWTKMSFGDRFASLYRQIHSTPWNEYIELQGGRFLKLAAPIQDFTTDEQFDLIYYDAFAPSKQSEMWTESRMKQMHDCLKPAGLLVTYCANGQFKRNLKSAGFKVKAAPGPPGKREMTIGEKEGSEGF